MANQIQTIVCPNCGASATNHHNCEYCGSFLVQRAAEGVDVTNYVRHALTVKTEGVDGVVKHYCELIDRFATKNDPQDIFLGVLSDEKCVMTFNPRFKASGDEQNGMYLELFPKNFQRLTAERFYSSPLCDAFQKYPITGSGFLGLFKKEYAYTADFGYDYKGASSLVMQLLKEVFLSEERGTVLEIYIAGDEDNVPDSIRYTLQGDIIESSGAGQNDFETI